MADLDLATLLRDGPKSAHEISKLLVESGVSPSAARKRIQRASGNIARLEKIKLAHGAQILYLKEHRNERRFDEKLLRLLEVEDSIYSTALRSIRARGGGLPAALFHTFSGSPLRLKKRIGSERVLENLLEVKLLTRINDASLGDFIFLSELDSSTISRAVLARLKAESIILLGLKNYFRNLGFVSYDATKIRGERERKHFGNFEWDLTGPSFIHPLTTVNSGKLIGGFFVADVVYSDRLSEADVDFFVSKFKTMRSLTNSRPFFAMLIGNEFEQVAFRELKRYGFLIATPRTLFGEEVAASLQQMVEILTDAAKLLKSSPEKLGALLDGLSKIEGAVLNIRGDLFEILVAYCTKQTTANWVDIRQIVTDPSSGERAEVDVYATGNASALMIECKGIQRQKLITESEVDDWITRKIPRIYKYICNKPNRAKKIEFSFWTTGGFDDDARKYLEQRSAKVGKYAITWKDRSDIFQYLKDNGLSELIRILEEYF